MTDNDDAINTLAALPKLIIEVYAYHSYMQALQTIL